MSMQTPESSSNSTASTRDIYTPSTDESSAYQGDVADLDPDVPISSVEPDVGLSSRESTASSESRLRTPSVSLTPAPLEQQDTRPLSSDARTGGNTRSGVSSIEARVRGINLSAGNDPLQISTTSAASGSPSTNGQPTRPPTVSSSSDGLLTQSQASQADAHLHPDLPSRSQSTPTRTLRNRRASSPGINTSPHNVADEELPQEARHDPAFQRAFEQVKELVNSLSVALSSSTLHTDANSTIQSLYRESTERAAFQCPSTRKVGFVGGSGVGKSSLINSLLDVYGLARTSNSGTACTCVATEYYYHPEASYAIEIDYFTHEDITEQFTELLRGLRDHHDHLGDNDLDERDREALEKKRRLAIDTFVAAFPGFLVHTQNRLVQVTEDEAIAMIMDLVRTHGPALMEGSHGLQTRHVFDTQERCSMYLSGIASDSTGLQQGAWPYIRNIKVYLKAEILRKGLILVDLPGLRDLNHARVRVAQDYIVQCDEVFAVCFAGRAATDDGVEAVFDLARRANLLNVGIICTKSDEILAEEAMRDWRGERAARIQEKLAQMNSLDDQIEDIEVGITDTEYTLQMEERSEETEEELQEEIINLNRSQRILKKQRAKLEFELKAYLIKTRNNIITRDLQQTYGDRANNGDLRVFLVSNHEYWEHRSKPRDEFQPYLQLSQIMALRRYFVSLVAKRRLEAVSNYINQEVPALVGSIQLWVQSGSSGGNAERMQVIRDAINEIDKSLDVAYCLPNSRVNSMALPATRQFNQHIDRLISQETHAWSQSARRASRAWSEWHHSTFSAFCRNYGDHSTVARGSHCWNDEAMESTFRDLKRPWETLLEQLKSDADTIRASSDSTLERATTMLGTYQTDPNGDRNESVRGLIRNLMHRQSTLGYAIDGVIDDFEASLSRLRTEALSGIRVSITGKIMEPHYSNCNAIYGRGSDARRKAIITNAFSDVQLFESFRRQFKTKFISIANVLQDKMRETVQEHVDAIQRDLETLRTENAALEGDRNPEFRERVRTEVENAQQRLTAVGASLDAITM